MEELQDTFPRLLLHHARVRPTHPATREKDLGIWQTWTWGDVAAEVRALACGLAAQGFKRGMHLAIIGDNRPRLYWSIAAAQALGGIPVPIPGGPPGPPPPGSLAEMAKSAMDRMRQDRNPPPSPFNNKPPKVGQMMAESKGGAGDPTAGPLGRTPELVTLKKGDWGKLPPKLAEDLAKAQHETVASEYREAIETYYRVISERSKGTKETPPKP